MMRRFLVLFVLALFSSGCVQEVSEDIFADQNLGNTEEVPIKHENLTKEDGQIVLPDANEESIDAKEDTQSEERFNEEVGQEVNRQVYWQFNKEWVSSSEPPDCPVPLEFLSPVEVSLASGIIYPGQIRGADYKTHGGFRFDDKKDNLVEVRAPMDAYLWRVSKYLSSSEVQYLMFFVADCGIMYRLDHLRFLTGKFEEIFDDFPNPSEDSRTTELNPRLFVEKGEFIATEVGIKGNVFFDFGVYDLRKTNGVVYDDSFIKKYGSVNEFGRNAICWLDYLKEPDRTTVKKMPATGVEGKISDYCD